MACDDPFVTAPIAPPLTPPQLAVLQKPPEGAQPFEPPVPSGPRATLPAPILPAGATRGRLLDIVV